MMMRTAADRKRNTVDVMSLAEVRDSIDRLDHAIVDLIAERGLFVEAAARYKTSQADVEAPKRVEQVIAKVRSLAQDRGLSPEIVEITYRAMIGAFIEHEKSVYDEICGRPRPDIEL